MQDKDYRFTISFTPDQAERIKSAAELRDLSVSQLVRRAVAMYLDAVDMMKKRKNG